MSRRILGMQRFGFFSVAAATGALALIVWFSSQAAADSSLKGYWKFDETSGATAVDSSERCLDRVRPRRLRPELGGAIERLLNQG